MSAFADALAIESQGQRYVLPWVRQRYGDVVINVGGRLAKTLQKHGDFFAMEEGSVTAFEMKVEKVKGSANLFLESWSNRSRMTPGWMFSCSADVLLYYFLDADELIVINLPALREWAFRDWTIARYPERRQNAREQLNDTWGWCVPVEDCLCVAAMGEGRYCPREELLERRARA